LEDKAGGQREAKVLPEISGEGPAKSLQNKVVHQTKRTTEDWRAGQRKDEGKF